MKALSRKSFAIAALTVAGVLGGVWIAKAVDQSNSGASAAAAVGSTVGRTASAARAANATLHTSGYNPERNAYFGDLHVHTKLSFDAYIFNVRASPDDAYRFAKGETIGHAGGFDVRLEGGPLDFVAVTDHSEFMGVLREAADPNTPAGREALAKQLNASDPASIMKAFQQFIAGMRDGSLPASFKDKAIAGRAWTEVKEAAARHNDPGQFTTFIAYEYTSAPDQKNMHRNVIFNGTRVPELPYTAQDSQNPEDLWRMMDSWRQRGIQVLAIPHNSNGSDGLMFQPTKFDGSPVDRTWAQLRARNEPLVEITQIKGTSETHPSLSPNDEWANFEILESYIGADKKITKFAGGYVRDALKNGLLIEEKTGVNPFHMGFIGSSDTHNAAPGSVEEHNFFSKVGKPDSTPELRGSVPPHGAKTWDGVDPAAAGSATRFQNWGASGLAGVWAEENTRASIFAALQRRETFATSGPRIKVRFFASYDLPSDLATRTDLVRYLYAHGVPMGGTLTPSRGTSPTFLVWGMRDPNGGFLQRAQVVKGWIENGKAMEKVYDVDCSDHVTLDRKTWRCGANGASVDLKTCTPTRFKGDVELRTTWRDPDFNPKQRAFYYLRVLENPSCRWSTWDALRNGTPPNPRLAPTIQERAWSSPIWYEPKA
jgi:Protein of unknown function (DUF3604)